ncbi:hypothetical protein B7P43_G18091 [Cryptotermes secundus]|uniref:Mos1 transposase HTH domain-containing protein n=1 Tax=Cryptotermes secundus TaxID=105785 RepID=A0A2J7Q2N6_9NEOP|nr:hypothetical protein B7P43_G18091 [Cryptotermes secundus]
MSQFEQHVNIKFMCKLGKSASETQSALQQVYGDTALKKSAVYDWIIWFKNGQEMLKNDQRTRRPSTFRTERMIGKVCDRRMTIAELEQEVGICHGSIHAILSNDLKMRRVSAKFGPRQLTTDQIECRMMVTGDLFDKSTQNPMFLKKILKKSCLIRSKDKVMLIAFFDLDGFVHHEFVLPGQIVTGHFYMQVLQRLHNAVWRKRHDEWQRQ